MQCIGQIASELKFGKLSATPTQREKTIIVSTESFILKQITISTISPSPRGQGEKTNRYGNSK